jgi:hypothetical protein
MKPKAKGNSFERKIANLLSARFKEKTGIEKSFRRNADSGSFFGGSNVKRTEAYDTEKATFGDIITPATFAFSLECKHYKAPPSFSLIMKQDVKDWDKWIGQAGQDCISANKKMAIIIKYNNVDEFVIVTEPHDLPVIIKYKEYSIVTLEAWLTLPDDKFFDEE